MQQGSMAGSANTLLCNNSISGVTTVYEAVSTLTVTRVEVELAAIKESAGR